MCSNFNITLFSLEGSEQHVWRLPVQQRDDTGDQIFMKPEGITVSLFSFGATSKRNLDWSDGGATPSVILLLIGTKGGCIFILSPLLRIKRCGSASGTPVIPVQKLAFQNVFDYGSYDDE